MKRKIFILFTFILLTRSAFVWSINLAIDSFQLYKPIPFSTLFYKVGYGYLSAFTYNYGLNALSAGIGTYVLVDSKLDWKWNRFAYNNKAFANSGMPSVVLGGIIPLTVPLGLYIYGRNIKNSDLQITGLALGQAAILSMTISSGIKVFTGRKPPGIS
jgi:hypothetical protein